MMRGVVALIVATAGAFFVPATNLRNGQGPAPRAARAGGPAVHQRRAYDPWGGRYVGEAPRPFLLPLMFVSGVCAAAVRGGFSALNSSPRANSRMLGWFSADSGRQDDDRLPKFGWPGRVAGEFMRHADIPPGEDAPLGVLVAGFSDDALEVLAEAVEAVWTGPDGVPYSDVPIAVLAKSDLRLRLRDILATLPARDSVIPEQPSTPAVPLVLLSGFSSVQTSATVRALQRLDLRGGVELQRPMFAVAVPNALDKTLGILLEEIEGDHRANSTRLAT